MSLFPHKKLVIGVFVLLLLSGCQNQSSTSAEVANSVVSNNYWQTFHNTKYGYTIELPSSWGAIQPYGESFRPDLYNDLETIGPNLPTAFDDDHYKYYMDIEVFSDQNTTRKANQSWFDLYKELRIEDQKYTILSDPANKNFDVTFYNSQGNERNTCHLIEHDNKLFSFCYNENNNTHTHIIQSIKLD